MNLLLGQRVILQQFDDVARGQRILGHIARQRRDAQVTARRREHGREVVGAQPARDRHRHRLALGREQTPDIVALHAAVDQRVVAAQLGRPFWHPLLLEVLGRSRQYPGVHAEKARAQRGIGQLAHAHRHIDALRHQVGVTVLEAQVHLHLRVLGHEVQRQRHSGEYGSVTPERMLSASSTSCTIDLHFS